MRSCRVSFRDRQGIDHSVTLQALHRYHAFGLAMFQLRKCAWCHPDYREVQRLVIEVLDRDSPRRREKIVLTRDEFETWLAQKHPNGLTDGTRRYLLMLLGRIPPDRDFKRGMTWR